MVAFTVVNGSQSIQLSNAAPQGFTKGTGASGFGIAPTTLTILEGASEGGRWRRTKRGPRDITLPIYFQADDELGILALQRQLVAVLQDSRSTPYLYATYPDGSQVFSEIHYAGGGDAQYGSDTNGKTYARWPITLRAPNPYFTDVKSINYSMSTQNSGRGLIKNTSLSKLELSSSSAIGRLTVENPGDVDAYPLWQLTGPGDFFSAYIDGYGLKYHDPIAAGQVVIIDTQAKTVKDASDPDSNLYGSLDPAPRFFAVPPGTTSVDVQMEGATADSRIQLNFQPRYEVVF